jgi:hypothetical protein
VANYQNGSIIQVDLDGNPESYISGQGHCLGMCIVDDTLYVSCNYWLRGFCLTTLDTVMNITYPLNGHFDGMTSDGNGNLFVVDTGGRLIKVNLVTQEPSVYMDLNMPGWPQDCIYDQQNNRIIVVTWATSGPIKAIDLADSSMYEVVQYSIGQWDGITIDDEGNFYLSSHVNLGCIYKYDNSFSDDPELISRGHAEPAGLGYNNRHDILAVPNYGGNTVDFIEIATAIDELDYNLPETIDVLSNYPNPFNAATIIKYKLTKASKINLGIYNILGQRIESLYSGVRQAGTHSATWNATGYASGIYLCAIETSENKSILRMLLMK